MNKVVATMTIGLLISILLVNLTISSSFAAKRVTSGFSMSCGPLINYTLHIENTCCWNEIALGDEGPFRLDRYCQTCTYHYPNPEATGPKPVGGLIGCGEPTKQKMSAEDQQAIEPVTPPKSNEDDSSNDDKNVGQNPTKDLSPSSSSSTSGSDSIELDNSNQELNIQDNDNSDSSNSQGSGNTTG